jgi:hypothetical protein
MAGPTATIPGATVGVNSPDAELRTVGVTIAADVEATVGASTRDEEAIIAGVAATSPGTRTGELMRDVDKIDAGAVAVSPGASAGALMPDADGTDAGSIATIGVIAGELTALADAIDAGATIKPAGGCPTGTASSCTLNPALAAMIASRETRATSTVRIILQSPGRRSES